jgi:hypothetical protein
MQTGRLFYNKGERQCRFAIPLSPDSNRQRAEEDKKATEEDDRGVEPEHRFG